MYAVYIYCICVSERERGRPEGGGGRKLGVHVHLLYLISQLVVPVIMNCAQVSCMLLRTSEDSRHVAQAVSNRLPTTAARV
jgi:hypothetical protein